MTQQRNAAIWYAQDGYDPVTKGINGRRVAGDSFLRGFFRHADVDEFVLLSKTSIELEPVRQLAAGLRPDRAVRGASLIRPTDIAPLTTLFYPSPNYAAECWRRGPYGQAAWAVCGITHTTSTTAVMQGMFDLRMAPVAPWDAVICTSTAVQASVLHQMALIDDHISAQFGATASSRPLFPVIPLGVHCADFIPDPAAGAALRARLGAGPNDVIFTTIARLTPHEKFDPLPIYLAMQRAQSTLPDQKLHIVFCGQFRDDHSRAVFTRGAATLMPDVGFTLLDGGNAEDRKAALSGADVFLFLIDNIQETFGLAPIEAMAAGLALLVSDWDGMKDTVTPDVGLRIPTRSLPPGHLVPEALRYQGGIDSYVQYCATTSALVEIDMEALTKAIATLAKDPDLRRNMGRAGQKRARELYDWSVIIPRMQDLWLEQDAMRAYGMPQARRYNGASLPIAPSPTALFANYPSAQTRFEGETLFISDQPPDLATVLSTRDYPALRRMFADAKQIAAVLTVAQTSGPIGTTVPALITATALSRSTVERVLIWLLKYGFLRR
ncbi:MAG: glycosyltransferase family 4 protein [Cypionkella sp.]